LAKPTKYGIGASRKRCHDVPSKLMNSAFAEHFAMWLKFGSKFEIGALGMHDGQPHCHFQFHVCVQSMCSVAFALIQNQPNCRVPPMTGPDRSLLERFVICTPPTKRYPANAPMRAQRVRLTYPVRRGSATNTAS
jgi:hypothetical protein